MGGMWTINGSPFNENVSIANPKVNTTEIWRFTNQSMLDHPIHMTKGRNNENWRAYFVTTVLVERKRCFFLNLHRVRPGGNLPNHCETNRLRLMLRIPRHHPWLLTLLCVTLLMVRVSGAHLHLCFDGKEPPASFHLFDVGLHHDTPEASATHQDADVAVTGDLFSKQDTWGRDLHLMLLAAGLLWGLLQTPRRFVSPFSTPTFYAAPAFLRPPLHGPPLSISL